MISIDYFGISGTIDTNGTVLDIAINEANMAKTIGTCDICNEPVLSNQGRMAQRGMIFKDGKQQYSDKKLWWHTYCFAKKNLNLDIGREPLTEKEVGYGCFKD